MRPIAAVFVKELRLLARDRLFLVLQLIVPGIVVMVFGGLFTITLRQVAVAVVDHDGSAAARTAVRDLASSPYFALGRERRAEDVLAAGEQVAVVQIPRGVGRRRGDGSAGVQILVDGTDGAAAAAGDYLEAFAAQAREPPRIRSAAEPLATETWFNPDRKDASFFLPGVLALVLFASPAIYCGTSLVREKQTGTWAVLAAAPLGDMELLTGKLAPYLVQAVAQAALLLGITVLGFGVPFRGSALALTAGTILFAVASIGLGALFAAVCATENQVWRLIQVLLLLPGLVLSGFLYPLSSMPWIAQALSHAFPARSYLQLLRGVLLKGADTTAVAAPLATLGAFAGATLLVAVMCLRRSRRVR